MAVAHLIDEFLPVYDVATRHEVAIVAPSERIWQCLKTVDINRSLAARMLFALRRLPAGRSGRAFPLRFDTLARSGFIFLGERPLDEILFGMIGKPWTARYPTCTLQPDEFLSFSDPSFAKIAMNFRLVGQPRALRLATERSLQSFTGRSFGPSAASFAQSGSGSLEAAPSQRKEKLLASILVACSERYAYRRSVGRADR